MCISTLKEERNDNDNNKHGDFCPILCHDCLSGKKRLLMIISFEKKQVITESHHAWENSFVFLKTCLQHDGLESPTLNKIPA